MPSAEILAVLADEANEAGEIIGASCEHMATAGDEAAFREAREQYVEQVQRIACACQALNLDGLRQVCAFVESNLAGLGVGDIDAGRRIIFGRWPLLALGYLRAPREGVYSCEIAEFFQRPDWPQPLDEEAAAEIERALMDLRDTDVVVQEPARETQAHPEDVVLDIPDDVNRKLVDAFLTEGPLQASEYSALIQRIVGGDGWAEELNECRRLIHALKGAANTVGVRGIATLCHHVEDILEYLVENAVQPAGDLGKLLISVADGLEMMFEALLGTGEAPADALGLLQTVLDWGNRIDRGEYDPEAQSFPELAGEFRTEAEGSEFPAPRIQESVTARPVKVEQVEPKVRVAVRTIDEMLRTSGEVTISSGHVRERLQQAFKVLTELRERHNVLWERSSDMEGFVATQGVAAGRRQALASMAGSMTPGFDPLEMDQYSELHTYVHGLTETVADLQLLSTRLIETLTAVDAAVHQQASLNDELHDLLMTSRMVPAGNLESRLQRTVRQAAEQCAKQTKLVIEGAEVMLDDQMVNVLIDPLQHLLRNAVDHGLEASAARVQAGKPEAGCIALSFMRDGNYLVITCRDDGAGLDLARIYARAIERGLIAEDQKLTDDDIARLILRSGLSTAETVTEVSGRGVGMDIVYTGISKLKGTINIQTQTGQGTSFTLRLPMSLGIAHCLLAVCADQAFALPTDHVDRIVYDGARQLVQSGDRLVYSDGEITCPAHFLRSLTGIPTGTISEGQDRHVVLVNDIQGRTALVLDSVIGGQDLVIKNMGRYLVGVRGVTGASILGDGSVVPILDVPELLRIDRGEFSVDQRTTTHDDARLAGTDILIVDDSLSVRTALSTLLAEEGFRVRTAKDGVEAIEAIGERRPAVVLADLEMPRMNGLELTAHIRANAATRNLPVIMLTSRTAEKHRNQAKAAGVDEYVTKPYREIDLVLCLRTMLNKAA